MNKDEYDKKCHEQKSRQYQLSEKIKNTYKLSKHLILQLNKLMIIHN